MPDRLIADRAAEPTPAVRPSNHGSASGDAVSSVLRLQRSAGNAATGQWLAANLQRRQVAGVGDCDRAREPEARWGEAGSLALNRAVSARRALARQHSPGGPYHPPEGTEMSCSMADDCSSISTKINYLRHTIRRHQEWDIANPDPRWPGGRHAAEIADLQRALANCVAIANTKCRGQPIYIPVPEESREDVARRVREQLYEALPWAVAVLVVGLIVACVIAEPCGAAVLAAVAAIGGAEAVAVVVAILVANGIMSEEEASAI